MRFRLNVSEKLAFDLWHSTVAYENELASGDTCHLLLKQFLYDTFNAEVAMLNKYSTSLNKI